MQEMTSVAEMFRRLRREGTHSVPSYEEHTRHQCDALNSSTGDLRDYNCPICKNKGVVYFVSSDGEIRSKMCSCMAMRESTARIRNSGLQNLMEIYTLERWKTDTLLQKHMKSTAEAFLKDPRNKWLFIGGQTGAGKSHICTAIAGELLRRGQSVRYMLWKDESTKLKAVITDESKYERMINPLKTVPVLYIDDLFKPVLDDRGARKQPSPGDTSLAFEIINSRYIAGNLTTIISSEWTIEELQRVEPATAGRIFQMATESYCLSIASGDEKNYRLRRKKA
ncbi:MAG: ATP-binding protein [Caproiciproducens sp.]